MPVGRDSSAAGGGLWQCSATELIGYSETLCWTSAYLRSDAPPASHRSSCSLDALHSPSHHSHAVQCFPQNHLPLALTPLDDCLSLG
eukprot:1141834-Pelagomonas_calceolata.AAC.4